MEKIEDFVKDREKLKWLIKHLKNDRDISYRKMEHELGIGRKKLSDLAKK